jgi:hypothetical protein
MTHLTRFLLLPIAICTFANTPLSAADAVEIKQIWPVGKKLLQVMKMDQSSSMEITPGQKMDQKMAITFEMSIGVSKHEDGKQKRLNIQYDRVAMDGAMGPQKMVYDSAKPTEDPLGLGKVMGAIVGKEMKMLVNAKEEVVDIENYEAFAAGLGAAGALPMGQMFGKEQLLDTMKQAGLAAQPGKPVKPGDSWPVEYTLKLPPIGAVTVKGTYTLKGPAQRDGVPCQEIAVNATLATGADAGAAGPLGAKLNNGKMTGSLWFDPALGIIRGIDMNQTMEIGMKNPVQPDATITIPTIQHITQTLTKVEDLK